MSRAMISAGQGNAEGGKTKSAARGTWRYRTERREVAFIFRDDSSNERSSDEAHPLRQVN
jgi:hypothetical protein